MAVDAGLMQRQDMMIAFYAGATAMLAMQIDLAGLSEDAAIGVLDGLHAESEDFCKHLQGL